MEEMVITAWPRRNPNTVRVTKINDLRSDIFHHIDHFTHAVDEFEEYGLSAEAECVRWIINDLWKHSEWLNEALRNSDQKIKDAQDQGRAWAEKKSEEVKQAPEEKKPESVTCPDCGWEWDACDTCPDCWYEFKSEDNKDA